MGITFRKRIKIAQGVNLNLGKRGASVSVGGKGSTLNIGKKGVQSTISAPGTGLSHTSTLVKTSKPSVSTSTSENGKERSFSILLWLGILLMPYIFSWFLFRKGHSMLGRVIGFLWLVVGVYILATR